MKQETRIISVCSQKGGSGKSAITIWLANCLSRENKRVLVLDADGQRTIAKLRTREIERIGKSENTCEVMATDDVASVLDERYEEFDFIFLDLPRMTGPDEAVMALTFCDSLLVPIRLGDSDVLSAFEFIKAAKKMGDIRKERGYDFNIYGVQNFRQHNLRENGDIDRYADMLDITIFDNALPNRADFMRVGTMDCPLDYSSIAEPYEAFYQEFKQRYQIL
ncbi:ParA family protein [Telluribacter humicola]|uniref:ParA family protein n=1 Tax=Telluribacter humicola TaxID=1720261 RepID=UPI001A9701AD|nr:ParA family protein [Telluribacter humicola]